MNNKIIEILKQKSYVVPSYLLKNYKLIGLSSNNAIVMIYLLNLGNYVVCDYQKFASDLNMDLKEIMAEINELVEKNILAIDIKKNSSSKLEEYINLEQFYNKIFLQFIDVKEESKESNIYSIFEKELGRSLSPIEYELINGWLECGYKEEIILEALKEAVFNGVNNFRYIDRILFEWNKKGIDTLDKVKKNKDKFKKENKVEVPDYDWLNDNE